MMGNASLQNLNGAFLVCKALLLQDSQQERVNVLVRQFACTHKRNQCTQVFILAQLKALARWFWIECQEMHGVKCSASLSRILSVSVILQLFALLSSGIDFEEHSRHWWSSTTNGAVPKWLEGNSEVIRLIMLASHYGLESRASCQIHSQLP